jgi:hypothetical protein
MDTLIGSLTALMAVLIIAVSFGALALVTTGAKLPPLPQRRSRRPAASTIGTTQLEASLDDTEMLVTPPEPIHQTVADNQAADALNVQSMDGDDISDQHDDESLQPLPGTPVRRENAANHTT